LAYQLLPNLILLLSILGVFVLVLRRLPEASNLDQKEAAAHAEPSLKLLAKGLPAKAASRSRAALSVAFRRLWHFMLEAKGMRQGPAVNYRIKKMWQRKASGPMRNEAFYLEQIKHFPKDLEQYNRLGQYYLDQKNFEEARNVYDYLTKHAASNSDYLAKLGYVMLHLQQYDQAVSSYNKALGLDPSHPNRYYNLALAYSALRDWAPALGALKKAVALEPANQKYQQMLAETRRKISQS
jgi:tetratricopeptide (TPR) repeat protein